MFRYFLDDVLSLNNSKFGDFVECIYPIELKIKDTTDTTRSTLKPLPPLNENTVSYVSIKNKLAFLRQMTTLNHTLSIVMYVLSHN
jgi:hypothetical protein